MNPYFKRKTSKQKKAKKLRTRRWWIIWRRWYRAEEYSGESYECDPDNSGDSDSDCETPYYEDSEFISTCGWVTSVTY